MNIHVTKHKDGRLAVVKKPTADSVAYVSQKYATESFIRNDKNYKEGLNLYMKEAEKWKMFSYLWVIIAYVNLFLIFIL